jgi:hypothetical protein
MDTWLTFRDLQRAGVVKNWPTLLSWQRDPDISFPRGKLFGANSRRWSQKEINEWISSRPVSREVVAA